MFLKRAMRYYRVWIYCCNIALLVSTLVFLVLSVWLLTDRQMALFPSVRFYQPSFIYGFVALLLQAGILQAIGCIGAVKMNEKLLNLYWNILVVLIFGDAIVGVIWLFRYNYIVTNLRTDLRLKLNNDYGFDPSFQELWDRIQMDSRCCGIDGPYDYNLTSWLMRRHQEFPEYHQLVPRSCCRMSPHQKHEPINFSCIESYSPDHIYIYGCYDSILMWLQRTTDILSVLGFCVISFLKVCFACILRYEIKEMIQKIQILKGTEDMIEPSPLHDLEAYLPRPSIQQDSQQTLLTNQSPQSTNPNVRRHRDSKTDKDIHASNSLQSRQSTLTNPNLNTNPNPTPNSPLSITTNKSTNGNNNQVNSLNMTPSLV